jgi:hypothetical protein
MFASHCLSLDTYGNSLLFSSTYKLDTLPVSVDCSQNPFKLCCFVSPVSSHLHKHGQGGAIANDPQLLHEQEEEEEEARQRVASEGNYFRGSVKRTA